MPAPPEASPRFLEAIHTPVALDLSAPHPLPLNLGPYDPVLPDPLQGVLTPVRNLEQWMHDQLGLSTNLYYTLIFQTASRTIPRPDGQGDWGRSWGSGRMDFNLDWNVFDDPVLGNGHLVMLMRSGAIIGQSDQYTMANAVGSINNLNAAADPDPASLNLFYWQQGWFDNRLTIAAGRLHPNQFIMLNPVANDESCQFMAGPMDGVDPFQPGLGTYSPGVAIQAAPFEWAYVDAIVIAPLDGPTGFFGQVGSGVWWSAVEAGLTPTWGDLHGKYALAWMSTNRGQDTTSLETEEWGNGWAFMLEQDVAPNVTAFVQGAWADGAVAAISNQVTAGLAISNSFGRRADMAGLAVSWSQPSDPADRDQVLVEAFYRLQITNSMQLSPDLQYIPEPSFGGTDPVVVFALRLKTQF